MHHMRKRRTRQHIIADLSVNFVERLILRQGHVAERIAFDYGYDLTLRTFTDSGEVEPGFVLLQLKASDSPTFVDDGKSLSLTLDTSDIEVWLQEPMPVIVVLFNAEKEEAYWIDVQSAVRSTLDTSTVTVRISTEKRLSEQTIETFRRFKQAAIELA